MVLRKTGTNRGDRSLAGLAGCQIEVREIELILSGAPEIDRPWAQGRKIFVANPNLEAGRAYDALADAGLLLEAALSVQFDDAALLAFVRKWGLIGAANPPCTVQIGDQPAFLVADGVLETRDALQQVQELTRWLAAIHSGQWRSGYLPKADHVPKGKRRHAQRFGFATALNDAFRRPWSPNSAVRVLPQLGLAKSDLPVAANIDASVRLPPAAARTGFVPILAVATAYDAMLIELWRRAIDPNHRLRLCRRCGVPFAISVTRQNKFFHEDACRFAFRERKRKADRRHRRTRLQ